MLKVLHILVSLTKHIITNSASFDKCKNCHQNIFLIVNMIIFAPFDEIRKFIRYSVRIDNNLFLKMVCYHRNMELVS